MTCFVRRLSVVATATCAVALMTPAMADIAWTGDITPDTPPTWTSTTEAIIGNMADGTLTVDGDSDLQSGHSFIGRETGATGQVTIDGAGSTWTSDDV